MMIRVTKNISTFLSLFLFSLVTYGQTAQNAQKLDELMEQIGQENRGMGTLAIFKDGKIVYQNSTGLANVAKDEKSTPATKYRIGSISKVYTAAIILKLIENGELALDTPLSTYYPSLPNAERITIEHLLKHRSGLYNFTNAEDYPTWMESPKSHDEMIDLFRDNGTVFEPGQRMEYSNTNYVLLSFIAEKIEKKPFSEILKAKITSPAGLTNTYYGGKIGNQPNEAFSYDFDSAWKPSTESDMSIPAGAGAVVATAGDVASFLYQLFNGDLLSEESLQKMTSMQDGYGLGLFVLPFKDKKSYGHTGGIDSFQSMASYFPEEKMSIVFLSNGMNAPINDILIGILTIYFGGEYSLPEIVDISSDDLKPLSGTYATPQLPIDLKIYHEGNKLYGQGTGQPPFPLEAINTRKFKFDQAGIVIEFIPEENKLILNQGGGKFEMTRKE